MDESGTNSKAPTRKHLLRASDIAQPTGSSIEIDLTRHHGQGNGIRVHGIYFAAVSLVVLVALLVVIAFASNMM